MAKRCRYWRVILRAQAESLWEQAWDLRRRGEESPDIVVRAAFREQAGVLTERAALLDDRANGAAP